MKPAQLLLVAFILSACNHEAKMETKDTETKKMYVVSLCDSTTQDCLEFLGSMEINSTKYEVINFFRRIKAAQMWHGQSRVIFLSETDTLTYSLNSNTDFPSSIDSNKLYFPQKKESRGIDSLGAIVCFPTGCINKEENLTDVKFFNPDSIGQVFKGGYLHFEN